MSDGEAFRKLALAERGAEEKSHFGKPDFRIGGKIFAGLQDNETIATLKLSPEVQSGLVDGTDEAPFYPAAGAWGQKGWTHVRLAKARDGLLRELLAEAAASVRRPVKSLEPSVPKASPARQKGTSKAVAPKKKATSAVSAKRQSRER